MIRQITKTFAVDPETVVTVTSELTDEAEAVVVTLSKGAKWRLNEKGLTVADVVDRLNGKNSTPYRG